MTLKPFSEIVLVKILSLIVLSAILASCGASRNTLAYKSSSSNIHDDILIYSNKYLGKPYRYAGKGPNSFDCSGFTSFVFKNFGYNLRSSSAGQDRQVTTVAAKEKLNKGDLVFFEGRRRNGNVGHVGIVTEVSPNGNFKFIHASTTSGVIISRSTEPYYSSRYLRGGRVLEENASYVTKQPKASSTPVQISPAFISKTATVEKANTTEETKTSTLVQTDPQKNKPIKKNQTNTAISETNTDIALRKEIDLIPEPIEIHIVHPGETLYSISRKYGCSVDELKKWNPQLSTNLKAGDELKIHNQ